MKKSIILFFALVCSFSVSAQIPQIQWQKSLGGTDEDVANSVIQTFDGGYFVAGGSFSSDGDVTGNHDSCDYWVVKLNASGTIEWQKSLGGTGNDDAFSVIQTFDSGYVVAGTTTSNDGDVTGNQGDRDYWVVKLNQSGAIEWQKSLGGTDWDEARSIVQTFDSGYVVAGFSNSIDGDVTGNHAGFDYWLVRLDATGAIKWEKSYGGTWNDQANSISQTLDSGYILAGTTNSNDGDVTGNHGNIDYWVVKLNVSGNIQWQKSLGGTGNDETYSVIQDSDSNYVIAGRSESNNGDVTSNHGIFDYWVVKLNTAGVLVWQKSLGGTNFEGASSIIQASDNGYVVAGWCLSNNGDVTGNHGWGDDWVVKLNASGVIEWQLCLGGTVDDGAYSIISASDSEYVIAGQAYSNDGDVTGNHGLSDYWVIKLGLATGIENLYTSNALHVYPNPSTDNFSIPSNSEFDNAQLNVFNAMGCNVYTCRLTREAKVIDAENFLSGIYYLQIIKGEKVWGEKIIKH